MNRRTAIIITLILAVFALLIGVYFAWMRARQEPPPIGVLPPAVPGEEIPDVEEEPRATLQLLSDNNVAGYWIAQDSVFYIAPDGQVFEAKPGKDVSVTSLPVGDIVGAWGGAQGAVLVKHGSAIAPKFGIYTSPANKWESLANVVSAALSQDGTRVAYLDSRGAVGTIALTSRGVGRRAPLASYNIADFNVAWAGDGAILLVPKPASLYDDGDIWRLDVRSRALAQFLPFSRGAMVRWSSDGAYGLLFGVDDMNNPYLRIVDDAGRTKGNVNFVTYPDKCAAIANTLYCGIPTVSNNENAQTMPDAYLRRETYFNDMIFAVNTKDNTSEFIFAGSLQNPIDVYNPIFKDNLYLINRWDQKLYRLVFGK